MIKVNFLMVLQQNDYSRIRSHILLVTKNRSYFLSPSVIHCPKWLNNKPTQFLLFCHAHVVFQVVFPVLKIIPFLWILFAIFQFSVFVAVLFCFSNNARWQKQYHSLIVMEGDCQNLHIMGSVFLN